MKRTTQRLILAFALIMLIALVQSGCVNQMPILVYDDSNLNFAQTALDTLMYSYTTTTDEDIFQDALTSREWGLVIFDNPNMNISPDLLTVLEDYVARGGRFIASSWSIGNYPGHGLWAELGYSFTATYYNLNDVNRLSVEEPIIDSPFVAPDLIITSVTDMYGTNGYPGSAIGSGRAIASFNSSTAADQGAVFVANDGRTILNAFLLADAYDYYGPNGAIDTNDNGMADAMEWWLDEISYVSAQPGKNIKPSAVIPMGNSSRVLGNNM